MRKNKFVYGIRYQPSIFHKETTHSSPQWPLKLRQVCSSPCTIAHGPDTRLSPAFSAPCSRAPSSSTKMISPRSRSRLCNTDTLKPDKEIPIDEESGLASGAALNPSISPHLSRQCSTSANTTDNSLPVSSQKKIRMNSDSLVCRTKSSR